MPETKKLLVAFNPSKPNAQSSDFLIPWMWENRCAFLGLKSGSEQSLGLVIFLGRSVSENDLFAKLVDTGAMIPSVEETLTSLRDYLDKLNDLRVGNVVRLVHPDENAGSFGLQVVAKTPSSAKA